MGTVCAGTARLLPKAAGIVRRRVNQGAATQPAGAPLGIIRITGCKFCKWS